MADPLCLPTTVDGWNEMKSYILDFIKDIFGNPTNNSLLIKENPTNDSIGYFLCRVFCKKSGKLVDISGSIVACWNNDGLRYLDIIFPDSLVCIYNIKPFHIWL